MPDPADTMGAMEPPPDPSDTTPRRAKAPAAKATEPPAAKAPAAKAPAAKATKPPAAKAAKATGARTGAAPVRSAARSAARSETDPDGATDPSDGARRFRGRGGNRALYSRPIQRNYEHWPLVTRILAAVLRHPETVLALTGDRKPVERDGRVLNRGIQAMLALADRFGRSVPGPSADADTPDPVRMRSQLRVSSRIAMPVRTDVHVEGRVIRGDEGTGGIPVRVYRQFGTGVGPGPASLPPAIVYFHGGGWVVGGLETHDGTCRLLAATSRCLVVAVDYRLAPEHPFPAAVDDCMAAYAWVQRNAEELGIAAGRVGVMGDSAGGNLAAVVAQQTRDRGDGPPPPVAQGLVYPAVDSRLDTESLTSMAEGFFLTRGEMEFFRASYLPDRGDWEDPRASPLLADDLDGVAPALVVTAGFDPLRDDGANYAEALRKAGVEVEYRCYHDQIHGFMGMGILADSLALATEVGEAMGRLMRRPTGADGASA